MTEIITHRAEFAGRERVFLLSRGGNDRTHPPMLYERHDISSLEMDCGVGIAGLLQRFANLTYRERDVRQTILFGLIGGGMPAGEAKALVQAHVDTQPLNAHAQLAVDILNRTVNGFVPRAPDDSQGE